MTRPPAHLRLADYNPCLMDVSYAESLPAGAAPRVPLQGAPRAVRWLCLLGVIAATGGLGWCGHLFIRTRSPDFEYFYKAGLSLRRHGQLDRGYDVRGGRVVERGTLDWYWPFVSRVFGVLALLPFRVAGYVWLTLNLVAVIAIINLLGRYLTGLPPRDWAVTQLVPFLVLGAYWVWEFRLNQVDTLTLLLIVGSYVCWERGRSAVAGVWLGLAFLIKLTPGLILVWFALKRQYRLLGAALLTIALAGPLADLAALGPDETAAAYRTWFRNAVTTGSSSALIQSQREMDWRNQAVGAVLCRWLHATNYSTHFDNDPRVDAKYGETEIRTLNVADLPLSTVSTLALAVSGLSLIGLIWLARRPARNLVLWQLRFEWALFVLAMLWFMPVVRLYHMIFALPAISVLGAGIHYAFWRSGWSRLAVVALVLMALSQLSLLSRSLQAGGLITASIAVLAIPLIVMLLRLGRRPTTLPTPAFAVAAGTAPRPDACTRSEVAPCS